MKVIILAAGQGTRLRPITDTMPKCMVTVKGRPILYWQIMNLRRSNSEISIVTGYREDMVRAFIEENGLEGLNIINNDDFATTDNIYSLYLGKDELRDHAFLLLNGDVFCDPAIYKEMIGSPHQNIVPYDRTHFDEEELKIAIEDGHVKEILPKRTKRGNCEGSTIGVFKMGREASRSLFQRLDVIIEEEKEKGQWFEYALNRIFSSHDFHPLDVSRYQWMEIDTVADLEKANNFKFTQEE